MGQDSSKKNILLQASLISFFSLVLLVAAKFLEVKYQVKLDSTLDLLLIAIIFVPFLAIVLNVKEAKLPGGVELKFEEIKKAQEAQSTQLEAVKNIAGSLMKTTLMNMLKPDDISTLTSLDQKRALSRTTALKESDENLDNEIIERLKRAGLVTVRQALQATAGEKGWREVLLTDVGKHFLENYEKEK
jgi:hypothetical protein